MWLSLFLNILVVEPRIARVPEIEEFSKGHYTMTNPLKKRVEFVVACGPDWEPMQVVVPPKTKQYFDIINNYEEAIGFCRLDSYRVIK